MMRNSKYTQEFRDSTIQLVMQGEKSVLQIGRDLDVNPKTIYNWVREYKIKNAIRIDSRGKSDITSTVKETPQEELKRLRAENKLLKQERDILKKATAYFAKGVV
jgi:transposase